MDTNLSLQSLWISPSGRVPETNPEDSAEVKASKIVQREYAHCKHRGYTDPEILIRIGWCGLWPSGYLATRKLTIEQLKILESIKKLADVEAGWEWYSESFKKLVERFFK